MKTMKTFFKSVKELRIICQESRKTQFYHESWFERNFFRRISIYFTKFFLKMGISASQATILSLSVMIVAGVLFTFVAPKYWLIGVSLLCLSLIFDRVDGEIARYNKSSSIKGAYLDSITYFIGWPFILTCMSFGIYGVYQKVTVFIVGFLAVISFFILYCSQWLQYVVLHEDGSLFDVLKSAKSKKSEGEYHSIIGRLGRVLFQILGGIATFFVAVVVDCFTSSITISAIPIIGSCSFNARYIYLIIYAILLSTASIVNLIDILRGGVQLHQF